MPNRAATLATTPASFAPTALAASPTAWSALIAALLLSGCAQLRPDFENQREASEQVSGIDKHSSFPALSRRTFEQINLIEMVDPQGRSRANTAHEHKATDPGSTTEGPSLGVRYDLALAWFRSTGEISKADKKLWRNGVQDKMLAVSTSRCNVFKTYLRRQQSDVNFALGSATTAAGAFGAIVRGAQDSRVLAGIAGLLSGVQAEYNSAYYSNLAAHVIAQGIELKQARLQKELVTARQDLSIDAYSMEAAINDAIVIDGTCSTVAGLLEAADSIKESSNPGLARAAEVMASVRVMNEIANAEKVSELADSGKLAKMLRASTISSSPLVVAAAKPDALASSLQALFNASQAPSHISAERAAVLARAEAGYKLAQARLSSDNQATADLSGDITKNLGAVIDTTIADLPVAQCTAALVQPASDLAGAELALKMVAKGDEAARIQAELAEQTARAASRAASQRVQALVDWASTEADRALRGWAPKFSTAKLTAATLGSPTMATVPDALKKLCS
jgi:hypothetical protein